MKHKLASWWKTIKLTANLMAGVPDYENYVARQRRHNPDAPVMTSYNSKTTAENAVAAATVDAVVNEGIKRPSENISDGLSLWNINKHQRFCLVINI